MHATRTVADVPTAVARDLVRRSTADDDLSVRWRDLEQPGGGRAAVRIALSESTATSLLAEVRDDDAMVAIVPASAVDARVRVLTVGGRHPLRDPARYPLETAASRRQPEVTTMTIVGDVMLGRRVAQVSGDDPIRVVLPHRITPPASRVRRRAIHRGYPAGNSEKVGPPNVLPDAKTVACRI